MKISQVLILLQLSGFYRGTSSSSSSSSSFTQSDLSCSKRCRNYYYGGNHGNDVASTTDPCRNDSIHHAINIIESLRGGDGETINAVDASNNDADMPSTSVNEVVDEQVIEQESSSTATATKTPTTNPLPATTLLSESIAPSPTTEKIKSKIDSKLKELHDRQRTRQEQSARQSSSPPSPSSSSSSSKKKIFQNQNNPNSLQNILSQGQSLILSCATNIFPHNTPLAVPFLTLLGTSIGFQSFLYFVTVGYALAVLLVSSVILLVYNISSNYAVPILTNLHTSLTLLWSLRLMIFLLYREYINWPQLHKRIIQVNERSRMESKFSVWVMCASFYAAMIMPCVYRMEDSLLVETSSSSNWGVVGGIGISLQSIGLLVESIADAQKSSFKSKLNGSNRSKWCHQGLWKYSTHPNFLGEGMFWLGTYLGGIGSFSKDIMSWAICTMGLLFITFVIRGAVESLSVKQLRNYGEEEEFLEFKRKVGFFGPFRLSQHLYEKTAYL